LKRLIEPFNEFPCLEAENPDYHTLNFTSLPPLLLLLLYFLPLFLSMVVGCMNIQSRRVG
jgi:hypothetical protein